MHAQHAAILVLASCCFWTGAAFVQGPARCSYGDKSCDGPAARGTGASTSDGVIGGSCAVVAAAAVVLVAARSARLRAAVLSVRAPLRRQVVARRFKDERSSYGPQTPDFAFIEALLEEAVPERAGAKACEAAAVVDLEASSSSFSTRSIGSSSAETRSGRVGWGTASQRTPAASAASAGKWSGKLNAELANGRLALLSAFAAPAPRGAAAVARRAAEEAATQEAKPEEATPAKAVPARPKELPDDDGYGWDPETVDKVEPFNPAKQVGVTAPLGYFDPLGFCKTGDIEGFRFKRASEIKHGRVAMMASVGLVVQHYIKLPGFERARNTFESQFAATFTVPALYIFSIFTFSLFFLELSLWAQEDAKEPGNFGDPFNVGMYDDDTRNREINNGRFAMFATVGIIAAQLYTGKDAVQQLGFD